jgi:photosystem II stability/assembly factor-like uncharacterized protein
MSWRLIGPAAAGGRVAAVAGSASDPKLYYVGAAGGGVWKSDNSGQTWDPVFDKQGVASIGAIAIDPTDDKTVWVGTGEANPRNDVSYGDGIYKTTDGGDTWTNMGLKGSKYISRVLVDPRNHNHVIVGALGDVFADSGERGVYLTDDGGKTWKQTLFAGSESGVSDMAMSTQNPNVVYAGIWKFQRRPWTFTSGGDEDGLYKSTDGGATWTKLEGHGLPAAPVGRIGVAVAPSNGNRVYALIESKDGVLWRSDDGGGTWAMVSKNKSLDARPFYFTHVAVDPKNPDRVYTISFQTMLSTDGGKTFKVIARDVHVDFHSIWIAPNDPTRIILGEDGGYALTIDGGQNWFFSANLPIGQVYRVGLGTDNPYTVCAGLQDNNGWCGPSNSLDPSGILNKHWIVTVGGDGTWGIPEPDDPNWIWSDSQDGSLSVYHRVTQDAYSAQPYLQTNSESWKTADSKYRFNWESPIAFAPWRAPGAKIIGWYGGNVVFQTTDRGRSWTPISPDLTRNVKSHQDTAGGPIYNDVSGAEYSDTILDIEASTLAKGEIWVGTDDGLVQLTRDGGKHWRNVTPRGAPEFGRFATVAPSSLVDGTTYAIEDAHEMGDSAPYAYVTRDFGRHWTKIVDGLPADEWARSIRPDIRNRDLVYLGTEEGIWISFDAGRTWQPFRNDLPPVSVHDIRMQPRYDDLVIATHGRTVYIMDDMRPVQGLGQAVNEGAWLFPPQTAYEWSLHSNDEGTYTDFAASNPPYGVTITFYQKETQKAAPSLEILDATGRVIRSVSGTHKVAGKDEPYVSNKVGLNRYTWDFNVNGPVKWNGATSEFSKGPDTGPSVVPGTYAVRMTLAGHAYVQHFKVEPDPRSAFTQADYERSFDEAMRQLAHVSQVDTMLNNLDDLKKAIDTALDAAKKANNSDLTTKLGDLSNARKTLFDSLAIDVEGEGTLQEGKLHEDVLDAFNAAQGIITPPVSDFLSRVDADYRAGVGRYNDFARTALPPVNNALKAAGMKPLPAIAAANAK